MPSFSEFLAWPDREEVVIAEFNPAVRLAAWTKTSGKTYVYEIALPRLVGTAQVAGGVYRPCTAVRENGTALTAAASVAAVDATASTWFWDEANGTLYVHSSTGDSPDDFTVYSALVRFYVATTGIVLDATDADADTGIYYQPWLQDQLPTIRDQMEDALSGRKVTPTGNVSLTNGHGFWHTVIAPDGIYAWKNKRVMFYLGGRYRGQSLLRSQYATRVTMLVEDVSANEEQAVFTLKPLTKQLDIELPVTPYFESAYPNLGDGVRGTKKWIGYGRATIRPDLTDTSSHGIYTVADAAYQTLFAVHNVWAAAKSTGARTLLTLTTHYTVDLTACTVTVVDATYAHADYVLEVDVTGKPDGSGGSLATFGAIVRDILQTFLGATSADLDTASFTAADEANPDALSVWVKSPRQLRSMMGGTEPGLPSLERSVMGRLGQTRAGLWRVDIWEPGYDVSTAVSLRKEDFATFSPEPKFETVFSTSRVFYAYDPATQEWAVEEATDVEVQYLDDAYERLDLYTYLTDASAAQRLAQRYQFISGAVSVEIAFAERGAKLAEQVAGDRVLVTYSPAPAAAGAYENRVFELIDLTSGVGSPMRIAGRLGDLRGIGARVGLWKDSAAPAWSAATSLERAQPGFWSDSGGLVDSADAATRDKSVWW